MIIDRRSLLVSATALPLVGAQPALVKRGRLFTPEAFGAIGDGTTNDTYAFAALASAVTAAGGGTIVLQRRTYQVGRQARGGSTATDYAFEPAPILDLVGLPLGLAIQGNGARLRAAARLRYGTFAEDGWPTHNAMPFYLPGQLATPYRFMLRVEDCRGPVEISDLELDGGLPDLTIGGQFGDTGWQIPATGLALINNRDAERIVRVHSHHHAQDGILVDGLDADRPASAVSLLREVTCEDNGRQGVSLVGGRDYRFERCRFARTGRAGLASAPGAGVDVEAEQGKSVRDIAFSGCVFADNHGPGLVADSGDSARLTFDDCTFIGTTNWAAWPNKPLSRFSRCTFVGPIVHACGDPDPERAVQFQDCTFRDDPALSPTGELYGGPNSDRPIADLPANRNVLFSACCFLLTHQAVLPWSVDVIYEDCLLKQHAPRESYPRGVYRGRNMITGRANIASSLVLGQLTINGQWIPLSRQE